MLSYEEIMQIALNRASRFRGATSPNPPVGAVALDPSGRILVCAAHEKAGTPHAEVNALNELKQAGHLNRLHTMVVTLEPCNHIGRTGPCARTLIESGVRRVVIGALDPNPRVTGHGAETLKQAGIDVRVGVKSEECAELIRPFAHWCKTRLPWITLKIARDENGGMIPPAGKKTFTSQNALRFAHELRKRSDAILTGCGTVIADRPHFTVRHVEDHPEKSRWLVIADRRGRTPKEWLVLAEERGFKPVISDDLSATLRMLGENGAHEVLVEAGPTLCAEILRAKIWNEKITIHKTGVTETITSELNPNWSNEAPGLARARTEASRPEIIEASHV